MANWKNIDRDGRRRTIYCVQSTQLAPTEPEPASPADGLHLAHLGGFSLHVECDEGHTFTAPGGKLLAYLLNDSTGRWSRSMDKGLTLTIPIEAVGKRSIVFSSAGVIPGRWRMNRTSSQVSRSPSV